MNPTCRRLLALAGMSMLIVALPNNAKVHAQKQPPPAQANPQAPVLKSAGPCGIQRGTTLDLVLTGTNLQEPTGLWTSFRAKTTIPTEGKNGKDATRLLVRLEVPADAPVGFHTLRLATTRGMSNFRLFCIDDLPQVLSNANNRSMKTAQVVPVPSVVVGRATAEANDYYQVTAMAGQRISFEVFGRRLGSSFDPQLTLLDAKTGHELPGGHSQDAPGLQTDPRLTYTFKQAGDYLVEIRDVSYRGGDDFAYRLRIGDFPCATTTLPLAARRGSKVKVQFAGPNVEGVEPVEVQVPETGANVIDVAPRGASGLHGWPVPLLLSDLEEVLEQEPNNEPAKANRVPVPGAVSGRFQNKGDLDHFVFALKKGQRVIIEAQTAELGSPAEVVMVLRDAKGAQVQATNPANPPRLDFTPKDDGDFVLAVEHLLYSFGPSETYRITIVPYKPGFDLTLQVDRFDAPQDGSVNVPVLVTRRDFNGPIDLFVEGPDGLSGSLTVPAGQPPANQPVQLPVKVAGTLPIGPLTFRVKGKAAINGKEVVVTASARAVASQNLANLPLPPRTTWSSLGLAVTARAPFSLSAMFDDKTAMTW